MEQMKMQFPEWTKVSEVELVYKTRVKASERPLIKSSADTYKLLLEIWDENKYSFIWFSGTDSITEILHKNLTEEDNAKFSEDKLEEYLDFDIDLDEHINKQYIKLRILSEKAKSSILFMDDTDKLTGKKLEIAKELLRNSNFFIITATDEHTINKTIIGY